MSLRAGLAALLGGCALANVAFAAPPLADYGKLPTVEQLSLSPAGDKIAFLESAGDVRRFIVKKVDGPALRGERRRSRRGRSAGSTMATC